MGNISKFSLYRMLFDRSVMSDDEFLRTDSYGKELEYVYKPVVLGVLSRFHIITGINTCLSLLLAYFVGGIFCYFTFLLTLFSAWAEFKYIRRDKRNMLDSDMEIMKEKYFTNTVYSTLPLQILSIVVLMMVFVREDTTLFERIGIILSAGYIGSTFGINSAHELIHRKEKFDQFIGGIMLSLECYSSFKVEHIRGHHALVSTPMDASSAPLGMSIYRFLPRAWIMNPVNGFKLEAKRLKAKGLSAWHWRNELIWWALLSFSYVFLSYLAFGVLGAVFFVAQAFMAITVLEAVNYVEHYGLERKKLENGRYERVTHLHSWNASEKRVSSVLLNLQRHSDHHAHAAKHYQTLNHYDDSPQLPTGYFGMMHLAFWPKKWFEVMDPLVEYHLNKNT